MKKIIDNAVIKIVWDVVDDFKSVFNFGALVGFTTITSGLSYELV